jgi:RNA polymerase sigma-32 factor
MDLKITDAESAEMEREADGLEIEPDEEQLAEVDSEAGSTSEELQLVEHGQLARLDPVRRYLLEISRFRPITPEEEHQLAVAYREEGSQEAAYRLVTAHLRLVVKIAFMYSRIYSNVMDLIQEGNIGLMEAVKRFDPYRGTRLPTYAAWWIKAYIIKFILDNFRIVRIGTTNQRRKLLFNLKKEKEKLRLQGIEPTTALLAERFDVAPEEIEAVEQNIESTDLSLDAYVDEEQSIQYSDTLRAAGEMIDEKLARGELKDLFSQKFREFAEMLNERERVILEERLIAEEPKTLQEIADRFGVTREAIRLSEKNLVAKIKVYMQEALQGLSDVEFGLIGRRGRSA